MDNLSKPTSINAIYNDLKSQGVKISKNELYLWADYACNIFMFIRLPKYTRSLIKENNSLQKYYCIDNGLRNAVLLPQSNDLGKSLENVVMLHLTRNLLPCDKLSYYSGIAECDFVLQRHDSVIELFQVSWSLTDAKTLSREVKGLTEASAATGCNKLTIITTDEERTIVHDGYHISVTPAWKWLLTYHQSL